MAGMPMALPNWRLEYFKTNYKKKVILLVIARIRGGYLDSSLAFSCTAATKGFCRTE